MAGILLTCKMGFLLACPFVEMEELFLHKKFAMTGLQIILQFKFKTVSLTVLPITQYGHVLDLQDLIVLQLVVTIKRQVLRHVTMALGLDV